jgi:hypothetical protein
MGNRNSVPGASGISGIVVAVLMVSVVISEVTHTYSHWPFVILGLLVGLMAVKSING